MRVLVVTQYFPPENVPIPAAVSRYLSRKGHSVRILTGYPNYPNGRVYQGYTQRWRSREAIDGTIEVCRTPLYASHSENAVARFLNYSSWSLSSATARGFARGADVIYVYATQMTAALGPWSWRRLGGAPYVLHVQDLWPDSIIGSSFISNGVAARATTALLDPWLTDVYQRASGVIGIAPAMVETLVNRGVPESRSHLVYNWADEFAMPKSPQVADKGSVRSETNVVYAGNMGDLQDLELSIRAAHRLRQRGLRLTLVGDGVATDRLRKLAGELGADNVVFAGRVPPDQVHAFYSDAHYALVSLKDLPAFRGTIPSKFQAALLHGTPLISNIRGDTARIIADAHVGYTAEPGNGESLVQAIEAAISQPETQRQAMAMRATATYRERFSFEAGAAEIERILLAAV